MSVGGANVRGVKLARSRGVIVRATGVHPEVLRAIFIEAGRCQRSPEWVAGNILTYWYEDVFLPTQDAKAAEKERKRVEAAKKRVFGE